MKRVAVAVVPYLAGILLACCFAAATSFPFLKPGDFSIGMEMIIMAVLSGFYILTFSPIAVVGEVLARKLRTHRLVPLVAIPMFGALFPVLGFTCFPERWWPEEPFDMTSGHLVVYIPLALCSSGAGVIFAILRHRAIVGGEK